MMGSTIASHAKVYCVIEKVYVHENCKIFVVAWYVDNNTPLNTADDKRLAVDTLDVCN